MWRPVLVYLVLGCAGPAVAQLSVNGAINAASRIPSGFPDYGVAQGALLAVTGSNLGPETEQQAAFPLPGREGLGGTTVQVTVGATSVDALLVSTSANLVTAILPSTTPVGEGTVTVTYGGRSGRAAIRIVEAAFGIVSEPGSQNGKAFAWNQANTGLERNTFLQSARPGRTVTVAGTGLGAIQAEERVAIEGLDSNADVRVRVGGQIARVVSRGRKGAAYRVAGLLDGLAALDQVSFEIPENVLGCSVPLTIEVGGRSSNWATISISADGGVCPELRALPEKDLARLQDGGAIKGASLSLLRAGLTVPVPGLGPLTVFIDLGSADFQILSAADVLPAFGIPPLSSGNCRVIPGQILNVNLTASGEIQTARKVGNGIDAGPTIRIRGSKGERQMRATVTGSYSDVIGQTIPGLLNDGFLDPGPYTVDNGSGAEVGAFSVAMNVPAPPVWSNAGEVNTIPRSQDLPIVWTNAGTSAAVTIIGFSTAANGDIASFECWPRPGESQFTIPAHVLRSMPASRPAGLTEVTAGVLVSIVEASRLEIPGLDTASGVGGTLTGKVVNFQ